MRGTLLLLVLTAVSPLQITKAKLTLSGTIGELRPAIECTAKANTDCKFCAKVECFVFGDGKWYPIGAGVVDMSEKDDITTIKSTDAPRKLSFDSTIGGEFEPSVKYKAVISIYPVAADEFDSYTGKPAFTEAVIGQIKE